MPVPLAPLLERARLAMGRAFGEDAGPFHREVVPAREAVGPVSGRLGA